MLNKQSWGWRFETPSHSLCRHCNVIHDFFVDSPFAAVVLTILGQTGKSVWYFEEDFKSIFSIETLCILIHSSVESVPSLFVTINKRRIKYWHRVRDKSLPVSLFIYAYPGLNELKDILVKHDWYTYIDVFGILCIIPCDWDCHCLWNSYYLLLCDLTSLKLFFASILYNFQN